MDGGKKVFDHQGSPQSKYVFLTTTTALAPAIGRLSFLQKSADSISTASTDVPRITGGIISAMLHI